MPTPFYHLSLANALLSIPEFPGGIRRFLETFHCEYMFGTTAPDVQVISGQDREATHFFDIPILAGDAAPWEQIIFKYPYLGQTDFLESGQVAFLAGYLSHLQADWRWIQDIFTPVFGLGCAWGSFDQRLYYHNVLRAYLDLNVISTLPHDMEACLMEVNPTRWLPFVPDENLVEWRDFLALQLRPGEVVQTVEVFSSRQGISAPEYYAFLKSNDRMQTEIFSHISLDKIAVYNQKVLEDNVQLLTRYLAPSLQSRSIKVEHRLYRGVRL